MAETYSVGFAGALAGQAAAFTAADLHTVTVSGAKNITVGDSVCHVPAAEGQAMQLNTQILCLNPDGSKTYYTYDAERSNPAQGIRILKRVAP